MALKVANTTIRELELSLNHEIWFIFISKRQPKIDPLRQPNFDPSMI